MSYASPQDAILAISRGDAVIVVDDTDRENEGDLIFAAEAANAEKVAFMVRHTSGVICAALSPERVHELRLPPMVADNSDSFRTAFTVSVDYNRGTTTGISASDRARTLRALASPDAVAADFNRPGHIFPLRAREGGVLRRAGHTEAASDLARLSGMRPHGVLCEIVDDDGSMARRPGLQRFAERHGLLLTTIADLVTYRRKTERWVVPVSESSIPTRFGNFHMRVYRSLLDDLEHVALFMGPVQGADDVPVRVHSECITSEAFGSLRCDCQGQLEDSMALIARAGQGVVVYLRGHEGRGIGLGNKVRAYALQDEGHDTVQANLALGFPVDNRRYDAAAHILRDLGLRSVRLISNNPEKFSSLETYGVAVTRRVRLPSQLNEHNQSYLRAKQNELGHDVVLSPQPERLQQRVPDAGVETEFPATTPESASHERDAALPRLKGNPRNETGHQELARL